MLKCETVSKPVKKTMNLIIQVYYCFKIINSKDPTNIFKKKITRYKLSVIVNTYNTIFESILLI